MRHDISACIRSILESFQWNETDVTGHYMKGQERLIVPSLSRSMLSNVYKFLLILLSSVKGKIFNGLNGLGPECGCLPERRWWEGTEECSHSLEPSFGIKTRHLCQKEEVFWLLLASSFRDLMASSRSSLSSFRTLENLFLFACLWSMCEGCNWGKLEPGERWLSGLVRLSQQIPPTPDQADCRVWSPLFNATCKGIESVRNMPYLFIRPTTPDLIQVT